MCSDCDARRTLARDAWLKARLGQAAAHVAKGAAEAVGLKRKTGAAELKKQSRKPSGDVPANGPVGHISQE